MEIIVDCRKMKHPNTGLYTFCKELIIEFERVKVEEGVELCYLFNRAAYNQFRSEGIEIDRYIINRVWDRLPLFISSKLFHSTVQLMSLPVRGSKVLTIHDLNFLYEKSESKAQRLITKLNREVKRVDQIVAISEFTKSDILRHLDVGDVPIEVIHNGCSFYGGESINEPSFVPQGEFLFTIGTVLAKKNFHVLPAILVGNNYDLIIAGNDSNYSKMVMDQAREHGVESRVHIIGSVSEAEKDWYFRNMRAFLFPSIAEGFGLPVIEAMYYGKPTFISSYTSLPEVGGEYSYYFDREFTPEKMRDLLLHGLSDFNDQKADMQRAHAMSFSWERAARSYCRLYKKLLEK